MNPARTYATVEQALQDMTPAEQAALGARLMGKFGHLIKRRVTTRGPEQLPLEPAAPETPPAEVPATAPEPIRKNSPFLILRS